VRFYEQPPADGVLVETPWADLWLSPDDWARAFGSPDPGTPHNEARDRIRDEIVSILVDRLAEQGGDRFEDGADLEGDEAYGDHRDDAGGDVSPDVLRASLLRDAGLTTAVDRAWPLLDAAELVADLWAVPAYLRHCAPWTSPEDRAALRRPAESAWTDADLPLLDAARHRLGDPDASHRRARHEASVASELEYRSQVIDDLVAADDDRESEVVMLRSSDLAEALAGAFDPDDAAHDHLVGPFAHVVVDEAQELTDAAWQMVLRRCPSRSLTVVGDRAQARGGFTETWQERLSRVGLTGVTVSPLTYNYRTPAAIMTEAEIVVRSAIPDANVPVSVRTTAGHEVRHGSVDELETVLEEWLAEHPDGTACVVGEPRFVGTSRVRSLAPELTKGLEFDLVVLVAPEALGSGVEGAVDRYVAMTRATERLVVLTR
jgi:hypothetical protein